jgi:hypothetical protein
MSDNPTEPTALLYFAAVTLLQERVHACHADTATLTAALPGRSLCLLQHTI